MQLTQMLDLAAILSATTLSKTTIYRRIKSGDFPAPVSISARRVAWREADIATWLEAHAGGAQ